jgi:hypothetical protein
VRGRGRDGADQQARHHADPRDDGARQERPAQRLGPLAIPVLALVAGFRMPGYVSNAMAIPLFKTLGP